MPKQVHANRDDKKSKHINGTKILDLIVKWSRRKLTFYS